jgi:hypothetical protein
MRRAQRWVATTQKFESVCRKTSVRALIDDLGCIVVDEIHLVGDPTGGSAPSPGLVPPALLGSAGGAQRGEHLAGQALDLFLLTRPDRDEVHGGEAELGEGAQPLGDGVWSDAAITSTTKARMVRRAAELRR